MGLGIPTSLAHDLGGLLVSFTMFSIAFVTQVIVLNRLNPKALFGDENEYWRKACSLPSSALWVRVPLGAFPLWIARKISKTATLHASRLIVSLISAITVGLVSWFAYQQVGMWGGLFAGLLIVMSAERAILSIHFWPDILLGLWLLLFSEILRGADSLMDMALLGAIAALGFLTRIDFTVLALFGGIFALSQASAPLPATCLVICPTLIAAGLMTLFNGKTHGVWAPDTTINFNFAVAATEIQHPRAATDELMSKTVQSQKSNHSYSLARSRHPTRNWIASIFLAARRMVILIGKETFVRQNLIMADKARYSKFPSGWQTKLFFLNLSVWFSALCIGFLFVSDGVAIEILALVAVVLFTQSMVQTRSRYRMALLPVLATNIAVATWSGGSEYLTSASAIYAMVLAAILIFFRPRNEVSNSN